MGCSESKDAVTSLPEKPKSPTPPPPTPAPTPTPTPPRSPTPIPSPVPSIEFSSDCVTKVIDNRQDEHPVKKTEDDYPSPSPPENQSDEVKPNNNWFENENFVNGSDEVVELHNIEPTINDADEDNLSLILRPRTEQLKTKKRPKVSFKEIDEHAKTANAMVADSFDSLLEYLRRPIPNDEANEEMFMARAIVVWLAQQDIDRKTFGQANLDTPNGLLQNLKENKMTYATCYTRLCRQAKIKCTLVNGLVKAASYEPGDKYAPSTHWTAVHVDGGWQLVHPFWICRAVFGHSLGGWVKIEADGTTLAEREEASRGVVRNTFQEYYFMPKPQHFIYECYAEDTPWQLLQSTSVIRSKNEFLELPYLLPPFFGVGLELISDRTCSLTATKGRCKIIMKANPNNTAHMLVLQYELFAKATDEGTKKFNKQHMSRMVFNSRSNEWFEFDIRFPEPGEFKFIVYGGPYKSPALRLCEFQIICKSPMKPCVLLPLACDEIGWGPGPASVDAGLLVPTRVSGFIQVPKTKPVRTDIKFQILPQRIKSKEYSASLHRQSDGEQIEDKRCVSCKTVNRWLIITVNLPAEGDFGLSISCHSINKKSSHTELTVCNYLLSTTSFRYVKANIKIAKQNLLEACDSDIHLPQKVENIKMLIAKCRHQGVDEDDEEFCAALAQFEYLYYQNDPDETSPAGAVSSGSSLFTELRWAVLRDHVGVAMRTLQRLSRYKYRDALQQEIKKVENVVKSHEK